jgi:hypothetical protein
MSEWVSVFAVFWILWAIDGARLAPRRVFTFVGCGRRARVTYDRLSLPGVIPTSWRVGAQDVPLALSPRGVCNRGIGTAGRPAERFEPLRAWRWEEVREVGVAKGWIYVNGHAFCPDTGHVRARELLALATMPEQERTQRIEAIVARWFRPAHLRRRVRVLERRTRLAAGLNLVLFGCFVALTVYVAADVPSRIPEHASRIVWAALPWLLGAMVVVHMAAVIAAARSIRRLPAVAGEKRGTALFSAALLPAQALRLRALAADGFFPPQHPLAMVAALAPAATLRTWAFNGVADQQWPSAPGGDSTLSRDVGAWFGAELYGHFGRLLRAAGVDVAELLAPPAPDGRESCTYCPRCGDQFTARGGVCPQGVPLRPLRATPVGASPRATADRRSVAD